MVTRDEFVRRMHSRLDAWNADIDALVAKAHDSTTDVRAEYDRQIAALKAKQAAARGRLEEMQLAGDNAWEDMKAGVEMAWSAMGEAIDSAKARFK